MIEENKTNLTIRGFNTIEEQSPRQGYLPLPDGEYSRAELLTILVNAWIPYVECHHCGRFSYCKFAKPLPNNPEIAKEIQCGIVVTALDNLLLVSWSKLLQYTHKELEKFFNGLFHFTQFVLESELAIGRCLDRDHLDWAGEALARKEFGYISHLRVYLDRFAAEFTDLIDFAATGRWVVVEGESEKAFIKRLGELGFYQDYAIGGIDEYGGKGNVKQSKLRLYVESLQNRGYQVALQGDIDHSKRNQLDDLVSTGLIQKDLTFPFTKDFEGAFPPPILHAALHLINHSVPLEWLSELMSHPSSEPIIKSVEAKLKLKVDKVELAYSLARVIWENWIQIYDKYSDTEIVKWLEFLQKGV